MVTSYVPWDVAQAAELCRSGPPATCMPRLPTAAIGSCDVPRMSKRECRQKPRPALNVSPGLQVISVERVSYATKNRPIEVSVSVMSGERYRLVYELQADDS